MAAEPADGALDQPRQRFSKPLDRSADLLGIHIRGSVLKPALENVELVQHHRLPRVQPTIGDKSLEDLIGVRAAVRQETSQA